MIIQKCKLTATKLSRKLTGPGVAGTRAFAIHPVDPRSCSSLIYCACIAEPAGAGGQTHASHDGKYGAEVEEVMKE